MANRLVPTTCYENRYPPVTADWAAVPTNNHACSETAMNVVTMSVQ